jgi:hypothetical protein
VRPVPALAEALLEPHLATGSLFLLVTLLRCFLVSLDLPSPPSSPCVHESSMRTTFHMYGRRFDRIRETARQPDDDAPSSCRPCCDLSRNLCGSNKSTYSLSSIILACDRSLVMFMLSIRLSSSVRVSYQQCNLPSLGDVWGGRGHFSM